MFLQEEVVSWRRARPRASCKTAKQNCAPCWVVGATARLDRAPVDRDGAPRFGLHQPWLVVDVLLERDGGSARADGAVLRSGAPGHLVKVGESGGAGRSCDARRRRRNIARPESMWRLLAPWITCGEARIERSAVYTFPFAHRKRWRDRRLFIAGDAAHQTPPFLGQECAPGSGMPRTCLEVSRPDCSTLPVGARAARSRVHERGARGQHHSRPRCEGRGRARPALPRRRQGEMGTCRRRSPGFPCREKRDLFPQPVPPTARASMPRSAATLFALFRLESRRRFSVIRSRPEAILLRPDRYVYGVARSRAEAEKLVEGASRESRTAEPHH